jgi:hypothetical protein
MILGTAGMLMVCLTASCGTADYEATNDEQLGIRKNPIPDIGTDDAAAAPTTDARRPADTRPSATAAPTAPKIDTSALNSQTPQSTAVAYYADLVLDGTVHTYYAGSQGIAVSIDVTNRGDYPAGGTGLVLFGSAPCSNATLYQYAGGTATTANTLNPGEKGYIYTLLPELEIAVMHRCTSFSVSIDLTHTLQAEVGHSGAYLNDTGTVYTGCLTWESEINTDNLGQSPDSHIAKSHIEDIVSSYTHVLQDPDGGEGPVCSHCHYTGSGKPYSPPVQQDQASPIQATDLIGGKMWIGDHGWAWEFMQHPDIKRPYMLDLFNVWWDDGTRP